MLYKNVRRCPRCFSEQIQIYNSREEKGTTRRTRKCVACGYSFKTLEIAEDDVQKLRENDAMYKELLELENKRSEILKGVADAEVL